MARPAGVLDTRYEADMAIFRTLSQWTALAVFLVLLAAVPLFAGRQILTMLTIMGVWLVAAYGLNILTGYAGQISIGHAAFVGVGCYTTAVLVARLGLNYFLTLPLAGLSAGVVGLVFGLPSLRLKGFYLAMATLAAQIVPFLDGPKLVVGQPESYFEPRASEERGTLFEHCARALDHSLTAGTHGLPLMGTGDWNDGMNEVGAEGKGESVWLGWFLHAVLSEWAKLADACGEDERAERWRSYVSALKESLEHEAWDGDWYRRAYFDDGTPLGSAVNDACRMDSIAQSWSVISAAADPARGERAMAAVDEYLVRRADGLVLLFTPPFDDTPLEPGSIKGYLPGVRENGGQYTHAAIWSAIAFAALGDGDKAAELFAMLNPINHASTEAGVRRYKVEPYVVAADVYAEPPHVGRGGWTWYTGSAGWMYRAGLESILGFRLRGARLRVDPCIPRAWHGFEMVFRYRSARYDIVVENTQGVSRGVSSVEVDGVSLDGELSIMLADDRKTHRVRIVLG